MEPGVWIAVALMVGFSFVFDWGIRRMLKEEEARSRSPFSEKLRRPAGESLRLEIDRVRTQVAETIITMVMSVTAGSIVIVLLSVSAPKLGWLVPAGFAIGALVGASGQWKKLKQRREKLRNLRLGFDGERYVAEELNGLMARGYRVFHDFVVDWLPGGEKTDFNIDHVVVGPEGVFAIETKTRRKPNLPGGGDTHVVTFDGRVLQYPGDVPRADAIDQAKANAKLLSTWLTGTAAEPVSVRPVVVIPGWYVKAENWATCGVQSAKGLAKRIPGLGRGPQLSEVEIQRLGDQIERHCRNVEGA